MTWHCRCGLWFRSLLHWNLCFEVRNLNLWWSFMAFRGFLVCFFNSFLFRDVNLWKQIEWHLFDPPTEIHRNFIDLSIEPDEDDLIERWHEFCRLEPTFKWILQQSLRVVPIASQLIKAWCEHICFHGISLQTHQFMSAWRKNALKIIGS